MLINLSLLLILIFAILLLLTAIANILSGAPYVPSDRKTIDRMLKEAKLKKGMRIYDLGCGDGRLLIRAEKQYGTIGTGYENAPIAFLIGQLYKLIYRSKIKIHFGNFFKASLQKADVIFLYLGPEVQKKLAPKIKKECKSGTIIIANSFHLPGQRTYKKIDKDSSSRRKTIHIYKIK